MLNFITGVKNSGKSVTAHRILGECAEKGERAMIIVPKQFTFDTDKSILHLLGPQAASEIEVLSFSRLCHVAVTTYGGIDKPVAKEGMREIYMSLAIEGVKDKLQVFSKHKNEIALVRMLLREVDSFKDSAITAEQAQQKAENVKDQLLRKKLLETAMIYSAYDAVVSRSHFDDGDMLMRVWEILRDKDFFDGTTVVIDGFKSFTEAEIRLIELMMKRCKNLYVTLCSDNIDDINDLSAYSCVNAVARQLRRCAGKTDTPVGEVIHCRRNEQDFSTEMLHLQRNIYLAEGESFPHETQKVTVIQADTAEKECDCAARQIKALIRQGEYRCRDIAVVYRKDEKYKSLMERCLKKYGLPLFQDNRQPIANQPLICFVRNLLNILKEGYNSDYIFRLVKTGLAGIEADKICEIENYVFIWDINGKMWLEDFRGNPEGFGYENGEKEKLRLADINETRKLIVTPVEKIRQEIREASGKKSAELIYRYLRENAVDQRLKAYALELEGKGFNELAAEQQQVWDILMKVLDVMAEGLGDTAVGIKRFCELFEIVVSSQSLGKLPDGYDEVYICSADRVLTKSAKVVFLMGMNNGVFPLNVTCESIFTQGELKKLREAEICLGEEQKRLTLQERFLCCNALTSAQQRLYLCYNTAPDGAGKMTKSECVTQVMALFPGCRTVYSSKEDLSELIESEEAAFAVMAANWHDISPRQQSLRKYFEEKDEYKDRLQSIKLAVSGQSDIIRDKQTAKALFGKDMYFSASQLEVYSKCPFMYFCRYGLKAKPRLKARLDAAMGGNVVHHVLEKILSERRGRDFLQMTGEEIDKAIRRHLEEYMRLYMGENDSMSIRFNYIYMRMHKILTHLLQRLTAEFEDSDFEPWDFEMTIGFSETVKPFRIDLDEGSVSLIGKIDRVDKMDRDGKRYIRIVDYKTGYKEFQLSDVFNGINMQMLLYLISIWRGGTEFYQSVTPAGILYFPARLMPYNVSRQDSSEAKKEKSFSSGRMNGMLVLDGDSIEAMDKSKKAIFIPVKFDKKTGEVKGNFITLSQLEKLGGVMDEIIADMGNSLHEGLVMQRPITGPGFTDTCLWCDYREICLSDNVVGRYAPKLTHDQCIRKLMGGDGDGEKMD